MIPRRPLPLVVLAAMGALLAACASQSKKSEKPAELTGFQSTARVERLWKINVGKSDPRLRLGLSLAISGDTLYAANHNGAVMAFDKTSGKRLWQTGTKLPLTGGPGVGDGLVVAGASHGDLVALDAATGAIKWKSYLNSELLSAPVIGNGVVVVRAVDGRVVAFDASDGTELWSAEQQVPRLSLRGISKPFIAGELVVVGFDNGRVMALQLQDGATVWDNNLAPSAGKTELERLNDIDTVLQVRGKDVYVVTFQGKAARIDLESGEVVWSRDESSYSGLDLDDTGVYITSADGSIVKLTLESIEAWNVKLLAWRQLSPPVVVGDLVAVGDFEGYVHFLNRADGAMAARVHPLGERVSADPIVSDGVLYMLDAAGNIVALRATETAAGTGSTTPTSGEVMENNAPLRPR